jgi:hypothetical protein
MPVIDGISWMVHPLGVFDRDILNAAVRVMDTSAALHGLSIMEGLSQALSTKAGCACRSLPSSPHH